MGTICEDDHCWSSRLGLAFFLGSHGKQSSINVGKFRVTWTDHSSIPLGHAQISCLESDRICGTPPEFCHWMERDFSPCPRKRRTILYQLLNPTASCCTADPEINAASCCAGVVSGRESTGSSRRGCVEMSKVLCTLQLSKGHTHSALQRGARQLSSQSWFPTSTEHAHRCWLIKHHYWLWFT